MVAAPGAASHRRLLPLLHPLLVRHLAGGDRPVQGHAARFQGLGHAAVDLGAGGVVGAALLHRVLLRRPRAAPHRRQNGAQAAPAGENQRTLPHLPFVDERRAGATGRQTAAHGQSQGPHFPLGHRRGGGRRFSAAVADSIEKQCRSTPRRQHPGAVHRLQQESVPDGQVLQGIVRSAFRGRRGGFEKVESVFERGRRLFSRHRRHQADVHPAAGNYRPEFQQRGFCCKKVLLEQLLLQQQQQFRGSASDRREVQHHSRAQRHRPVRTGR